MPSNASLSANALATLCPRSRPNRAASSRRALPGNLAVFAAALMARGSGTALSASIARVVSTRTSSALWASGPSSGNFCSNAKPRSRSGPRRDHRKKTISAASSKTIHSPWLRMNVATESNVRVSQGSACLVCANAATICGITNTSNATITPSATMPTSAG